MANYGVSRNIEASLIDYIRDKLVEYNWNNVSVVKSFKQASQKELPVIVVFVDNTYYNYVGIGDRSVRREVSINIHVFATSDGQRLDLKDFLIRVLKMGVPYYEYTIENGRVASKNFITNLFVEEITDRKMFNVEDLSSLDYEDRYRHYIRVLMSLPVVEV